MALWREMLEQQAPPNALQPEPAPERQDVEPHNGDGPAPDVPVAPTAV